jgi:ribonuclease P protein component
MRTLFTLTKPEIDAAFKVAVLKTRGPGLKLLMAPAAAGATHGKMLFIVPRTSGKAHDRNKFRRRVKSIFYTEELYLKPAVWIVIAYPKALIADFDTIKNFFVTTLSK